MGAIGGWLLAQILGLGGIVRGVLKSLPWQVYAGVAVLIGALILWRVHVGWERAHWNAGYNVGFNREWRSKQRLIAAVRRETVKATVAQITVNAQPAIQSQRIAEISDEQAKLYYEKGRAAGAAYAAAHRIDVRPAGNDTERAGGRSDLPTADPAGQGVHGPGDTAGMVTLTQADFDLFVAAGLRLAKVHQDAAELIATGLAVPATEPEPSPSERTNQ